MKIRWEGFAVFALFFGIAMLDAFQTHNWIRVAFWLIVSSLFLFAGAKRRNI